MGIKPVLGCEVYVAPGSRFDRENTGGEDRYYHLVLLAENDQGYKNLMKIVSKGFVEGFYYKPRVDYEVLETYHEGVIASAPVWPEKCRNIWPEECMRRPCVLHSGMREYLGKIILSGASGSWASRTEDGKSGLLRLSRDTGIELVATNDIHYTFAEDEKAHDILLCIQTGKSSG